MLSNTPIPGTSRLEDVDENLAAAEDPNSWRARCAREVRGGDDRYSGVDRYGRDVDHGDAGLRRRQHALPRADGQPLSATEGVWDPGVREQRPPGQAGRVS